MEFLTTQSRASIDWTTGQLSGAGIQQSVKTLGELRGMFADEVARLAMPQATVVYRVQCVRTAPEGTEGTLYWGNTTIEPGLVGDEYFMTHGHFHAKRNRGEIYATVRGTGLLLLMNGDGETWAEEMVPGSIHHIAAGLAHRAVNIGDTALRFAACWPADAGHDYESIALKGFGVRVLRRDGHAILLQP